jgi:cytochrome P450
LNLENIESHEKKEYGFIKQIAEESQDMKELRDQLLNVLLAGRDTTACCLSWTLYVSHNPSRLFFSSADFVSTIFSRLLVRHPNVMARLRQEISSIMESSHIPSREQIKRIPYLACVIKESECIFYLRS